MVLMSHGKTYHVLWIMLLVHMGIYNHVADYKHNLLLLAHVCVILIWNANIPHFGSFRIQTVFTCNYIRIVASSFIIIYSFTFSLYVHY